MEVCSWYVGSVVPLCPASGGVVDQRKLKKNSHPLTFMVPQLRLLFPDQEY